MKTCKKKYSSEDDLLHYMKIYEIKLHFALFSIIHSWNEVSYLIYDEARKKQQQKRWKTEHQVWSTRTFSLNQLLPREPKWAYSLQIYFVSFKWILVNKKWVDLQAISSSGPPNRQNWDSAETEPLPNQPKLDSAEFEHSAIFSKVWPNIRPNHS